MPTLRSIALNCTLKPGAAASSTQLLLDEINEQLRSHGVDTADDVRVADHAIKPGVTSDEGAGDEWPELRDRVLDAEILILGTPIWLGQPSSVAKRVLERMDAFLGETDDEGRMPSYGKVALVAVVGNEDGAHHVCAELYQALNDVGFSFAAGAATYWVGEAMRKTDYKDKEPRPAKTQDATKSAVRNTVHLATLLQGSPYPGA
jgi:multimeric flavodoxin WrbA